MLWEIQTFEHRFSKLDCTFLNKKLLLFHIFIAEAMNAIILHSPTVESLLTRRKISKEVLFRYLHEKKISSIPSADKRTFVEEIIQLWRADTKQMQVDKKN